MLLFEIFHDAKPLFVCRPLCNTDEIKSWAADQGFASTLDSDLHVTIAFSKQPVAWHQFEPHHNRLIVRGGQRCVKQLGEGAIVLTFPARLLHQRWDEFRKAGASWDHASYQPHVTISFQSDLDPTTIKPFRGDLIFGPEKFSVPEDDWAAKIEEQPLQPI